MKFFNNPNCEKDGVIGSFLLKNQSLPSKTDERWEYAGKIQNIHIYPVKSCGAITVKSANVQKFGLVHGKMIDRQFLIVDQKHNLITGRMQPKLVLVQPWFENGTLTLKAPEMQTFELTVPNSSEGFECVTTTVRKFSKS